MMTEEREFYVDQRQTRRDVKDATFSMRYGTDPGMRARGEAALAAFDKETAERERVRLDPVGASVVHVTPHLLELACHSHATQVIGPLEARDYLERRAATHNANWHPDLAPPSLNPHAVRAECANCGAEIYRNYGWHHNAPSACAAPVPIERTF